jgi:hypothetical protein
MAHFSPARNAVAFVPPTNILRRLIAILSMLLVAISTLAQTQDQTPSPQDSKTGQATTGQTSSGQPTPPPPAGQSARAPATNVVIPAGTRLALVLTSPVASKTVHRGDLVYAQMTAPVAVGNAVAIPAGTFVQGKVDKLTRNGSRAEMALQSVSVMFPDGYVADVAGPLNIETDEGTAWKVASKGGIIGAIAAPAIGGTTGALIGHAANSSSGTTVNGMTVNPSRLQSTAIGSIAGLAAGSAVGFVFLARSHQFFVDAGSPMQLTLPQPLTLAQAQIDDAVRQSQTQPSPITPVARRPPPSLPDTTHMCYTPETPGTPPTVIPGTPPIGNSPGTPPTVIPGTPAIPGTPYPCN